MTPDDAGTPPKAHTDMAWDFFDDLVPEGSVPIHGMRLVTLLDEDGRQWIQWSHAGDPSIDEVVAMLSRMTFLVQMAEFAIGPPDDEDDDD